MQFIKYILFIHENSPGAKEIQTRNCASICNYGLVSIFILEDEISKFI